MALAEAEIEYADDACTSIYVKFALNQDFGKLAPFGGVANTYVIIWTTTPGPCLGTWPLPSIPQRSMSFWTQGRSAIS